MSAAAHALARRLRAISDAYSGTCTWSLSDLTTGDHLGHDEDAVMPTASLIKVPVLVALYQSVADGRVSLGDPVTYGPEHRCLGSGVLSRLDFGVRLSVRDAAVLMMIISDNSATNICIDLVGLSFVNDTAERLGLRATRLFRRLGDGSVGLDARKMSVSSAVDIASLMTMIARHECVSPAASEDMLRIMRRSDYRHELSRELPWNEMNMLGDPKEAWVAEKGGSFLNGIRTGGAVFKGPRGSFAMAAFCEGGTGTGTGREAEGNVTLGRLGKAAWDALAAA
ncbi:MAG TPA: serine hydrolase [Dehalococcoidia bacterium]|nr:serine hydrolase [Dehalococcoidia bacterium]